MTFPTNYPVGYRQWYSRGKNSLNNDIDGWRDSVSVDVIGWTFRRKIETDDGVHEALDENHGRLQVTSDFTWAARDRVDIPDFGTFQIEGLDEATAGFHGWQPAFTLKILRVEGG